MRLEHDQVLLVDGSTTGTKVVAVKLGAEKFQSPFEAREAQLLMASLVAAYHHQSKDKSQLSLPGQRHLARSC